LFPEFIVGGILRAYAGKRNLMGIFQYSGEAAVPYVINDVAFCCSIKIGIDIAFKLEINVASRALIKFSRDGSMLRHAIIIGFAILSKTYFTMVLSFFLSLSFLILQKHYICAKH
jgi:hypothetical protein